VSGAPDGDVALVLGCRQPQAVLLRFPLEPTEGDDGSAAGVRIEIPAPCRRRGEAVAMTVGDPAGGVAEMLSCSEGLRETAASDNRPGGLR